VKAIIRQKPGSIAICTIAIAILTHGTLFPQVFELTKVSDRVFVVSHPDYGDQVVIESAKGLVVFDSFWSEKTAGKFKEQISRLLGQGHFSYVVNMVDRLDMMGGNAAYPEAIVVGHDNIPIKYSREAMVRTELKELITMWREKEGYSRNRMQRLDPGSEKAANEQKWLSKCRNMADDLQENFSLILPSISFSDRMKLDLQDMTVQLQWFGEAGNYHGLTVAVVPEERVAILSKSIINPAYHLAPYPQPFFGVLDVPRWISVLEQMIEGDHAVDNIILSDSHEVYSRERMQSHLEYIRRLWNSVRALEREGKNLEDIQDRLSLEREFTFVKGMQIYKTKGDAWLRPQHEMHTRLFFLQGKTLASQIIKEGGTEFLRASLDKIRKLGSDVYFDEISLDRIGYEWLNVGKLSEALEVYRLNAETFPRSPRAFDSLGEAYVKNGEIKTAIKSFKRSLELDPDNKNAKAMLENLETK
jgi:hypothetical protein